MSNMELFLYDDHKSLFLRLLTNYINAEKKNIVKILSINNATRDMLKLPTEPFLVSEGKIINNEIDISYKISTLAGRREDLFAVWNGEKVHSVNYLNEYKKEFEDMPKFITSLDKLLEVFTFINAVHITLLDIYTYSQIIRHMAAMPENEKNKFTNIIRWINHLQNLENLKQIITELKLNISIPFEPLILLKEEAVKVEGKKALAKEAAAEKAEFNKKQKEMRMGQGKEEGKDATKKEEKTEGEKVEKKEPKKQKAPAKKVEDNVAAISKLDIRVGKITSIVENTESDKLYNELIDMGNGEVRKIASGLKGKYPMEKLQDAYVIVLCNLKERTLKGWPSHGMLLCASAADGSVEPLKAPEGSEPGDLVSIENFPRTPVETLNPKKSPWDEVKAELTVDAFKVAQYKKENTWTTPKGKITVATLDNSTIG